MLIRLGSPVFIRLASDDNRTLTDVCFSDVEVDDMEIEFSYFCQNYERLGFLRSQ